MSNLLIEHIAQEIIELNTPVVLVENSDGFLFRPDVIELLSAKGIIIHAGSQLSQRLQYELRKPDECIVLLSASKGRYLEDILSKSLRFNFSLKDFIPGYHLQTLLGADIKALAELSKEEPLIEFSKGETIQALQRIQEYIPSFNLREFQEKLQSYLSLSNQDWHQIASEIAKAIIETIDTDFFNSVCNEVERANEAFQAYLANNFNQAKNASAVKRPTIVSNILDYLDFNFKKDKVALIVVDGLSFWQYQLLKSNLPGTIEEQTIFSWIPSITQLSRQAIFRGDIPVREYRQGPISEQKLWENYWLNKNFSINEVRYNHENIDLDNLTNVRRFALVYKELDDYMHSSVDYLDLFKLTQNWIHRRNITATVSTLLKLGFKVFITTDHGNIEANGWRGLRGKEKLGTNKSGSRSQRHIEYSETWLKDEFIKNNPSLRNDIVAEDSAIYFKSNKSFSNTEKLVTHGGAHILEVLIPFITITNGQEE